MTNTKHTPGPWRVYKGGIHPTFNKNGKAVSEKNCNDSFAICGEFYGPDSLFNMKLVAAAPELLEACKDAIVLMKVKTPPNDEIGNLAINKIQDVIVKAEGKMNMKERNQNVNISKS